MTPFIRPLIVCFTLVTVFLTLAITPVISWAQVSIVATVNGKPITDYDVEQRSAFLQFATDIQITDQNRERLYEDALQLLIDDKLKLSAAKDLIPNIEAVGLPRVNKLIDETFGTDGKPGKIVLRNAGVDPFTVQQKYLGDVAWSNFLSMRFADKIKNFDQRVDDELKRLKANALKPQVNLAEIVLAAGPSRNLEQTQALAKEMVEAIRRGANFSEIARQYSVSGTAANGGYVGWTVSERIPEIFREAAAAIEVGAVTEPIILDGAVYILRLNGKRKDGAVDASQTRVWLARALHLLPENASDADRLEIGAKIERDTELVTSCDEMVALNDKYGSDAVAKLDDMVIGDLAPQMQKLIKSLTVNVPSSPLGFAEGIASLMLCRTELPVIELPPREEIEQTLLNNIYGSLSERQLVRLRRTAVIERLDN